MNNNVISNKIFTRELVRAQKAIERVISLAQIIYRNKSYVTTKKNVYTEMHICFNLLMINYPNYFLHYLNRVDNENIMFILFAFRMLHEFMRKFRLQPHYVKTQSYKIIKAKADNLFSVA